jgi:hypothetical protein
VAGKRTLNFNTSYFSELNGLNAYWLGFIQADGNIHVNRNRKTLTIEINKKDIEILERFKDDIEATQHQIYDCDKDGVRIRIHCNSLCEDLMKLEVLPRKSFTGTFPKMTDEILTRHFIRGVFDGDGSVMIKKPKMVPRVVILGSKEFCDFYFRLIQSYTGITTGGVYAYSTVFGITFQGFKSCELFYNWIYKDAEFFLSRKKERFNSYFDLRKIS